MNEVLKWYEDNTYYSVKSGNVTFDIQNNDYWEFHRLLTNQCYKLEEKDKEIERLNKDLDTAIEICNNRQKEIVKLNNIINEFIDDIEEYLYSNLKVFCGDYDIHYRDLEIQDKHCEGFDFTIKLQEKINKLKELKGSDK